MANDTNTKTSDSLVDRKSSCHNAMWKNNHQKSRSDIADQFKQAARRRSSIEASEYNFSRRTSLYNNGISGSRKSAASNHSTKSSSSEAGKNSSAANGLFLHGRRNSILQQELSQFELEIRDVLPESVEEIDEAELECEYEEHGVEKPGASPEASPYKVGRAQFYSCQRQSTLVKSDHHEFLVGKSDKNFESHGTQQQRKGSLRRGSLSLGINGSTIGKWVKSGQCYKACYYKQNKNPQNKRFLPF